MKTGTIGRHNHQQRRWDMETKRLRGWRDRGDKGNIEWQSTNLGNGRTTIPPHRLNSFCVEDWLLLAWGLVHVAHITLLGLLWQVKRVKWGE